MYKTIEHYTDTTDLDVIADWRTSLQAARYAKERVQWETTAFVEVFDPADNLLAVVRE